MVLIKDYVYKISGLRYILSRLNIQSDLGIRYLNSLPYMHERDLINEELDRVQSICTILKDDKYTDSINSICLKLSQIKDIGGTISRIEEQKILGEIDLFELKVFALIAMDIRKIQDENNIDLFKSPDINSVIEILDPNGNRLPNFYVYDEYSEELAKIRKQIKELKDDAEEERANLFAQSSLLEDEILRQLSEQIHSHKMDILSAIRNIALFDITIAKAKQAIEMNFCKPLLKEGKVHFKNIFNPELKDILNGQNKRYQTIDVDLDHKACLITGANMAGKTVLLKTLGLVQSLMQFGFYVPAEYAEMNIFDNVMISYGDMQDELKGLSSYAAEMYEIDKIVKCIKEGNNPLVLIDEPARTTNPTEGKAIVNALLQFFTDNNILAVITSHYEGISANCKKLRVKGFMDESVLPEDLSISNINNYVDYSLIDDDSTDVPHEAIRIARVLNIDEELLNSVECFLDDK